MTQLLFCQHNLSYYLGISRHEKDLRDGWPYLSYYRIRYKSKLEWIHNAGCHRGRIYVGSWNREERKSLKRKNSGQHKSLTSKVSWKMQWSSIQWSLFLTTIGYIKNIEYNNFSFSFFESGKDDLKLGMGHVLFWHKWCIF